MVAKDLKLNFWYELALIIAALLSNYSLTKIFRIKMNIFTLGSKFLTKFSAEFKWGSISLIAKNIQKNKINEIFA